ncbi:MAG: DUF554 domain-containing protein [Bacillota bacterium]|jgi:uncharacterized membrane protein YqgA involved in biofilm formation|nr:DUF554 domain-containing protein [Bacillota bacterium]NLL26489.1 DUF554 domain-containing protein [Erysipelotrichia bacterium]
MYGAIINAILVVIGTTIGMVVGKFLKEDLQNQLIIAMGLCVLFIGIDGMLEMKSPLNMLLSMSIGTLIGNVIDLDGMIVKAGDKIQQKFSSKSPIASGFVNASLLFCVGGMAIVGSIQDGLTSDYSILLMKGIIDAVSAIVLAAKYGIGVYFSAGFILIYEGSLSLLALVIAPILTNECIIQLSAVGSIVLLAVGLNMLNIIKAKPMNMVPAIILSAILTIVFAI